MRTLGLALAVPLVGAALSSSAAAQSRTAKVVPCPDTITLSSTQPGREVRFVVRGAVNGVALIAPRVETVRGPNSVELIASTPAQLVVPQATVRLVLRPLDDGRNLRIERSGRDADGRTQYLRAQGREVALARAGGTALQVIADEVSVRRDR